MFQSAIEIDPAFAAAWGELAVVHAKNLFWELDRSPDRRSRAEDAVARAERLAPDAPEILRLKASFVYLAHRDYERASTAFRRLIEQQPNDAQNYASLAGILRRQGRWTEAITANQRAVELEPANIAALRVHLATLIQVRRWPEAKGVQRRLVTLLPGDLSEQLMAAVLESDTETGLARLLASMTSAQQESPFGIRLRKALAVTRDDYDEFRILDDAHPLLPEVESKETALERAAEMHLAHGQPDLARTTAGKLLEFTEAGTSGSRTSVRRAMALGLLGRTEEALRSLEELDRLAPASSDAVQTHLFRFYRAKVLALADRREEALTELRHLLEAPSDVNVRRIREQTIFRWKMRDHAGYQALLADPRNDAPLF